jgi:hypothetical protein
VQREAGAASPWFGYRPAVLLKDESSWTTRRDDETDGQRGDEQIDNVQILSGKTCNVHICSV